jgi:hypothetical protein
MPGILPQPGNDDPISKNMSVMNPADLAAMKQGGSVTADTPLVDFFGNLGLDVATATVGDFANWSKKQMEKGNPVGKMVNMAGGDQSPGGPSGAPGPQMGQGQASAPGGLDEILNSAR